MSKKEKRKDLKDLGAFERSGGIVFSDLAAEIAGLGFKTAPTTPHQIDGVRLSETKGAHKS